MANAHFPQFLDGRVIVSLGETTCEKRLLNTRTCCNWDSLGPWPWVMTGAVDICPADMPRSLRLSLAPCPQVSLHHEKLPGFH